MPAEWGCTKLVLCAGTRKEEGCQAARVLRGVQEPE